MSTRKAALPRAKRADAALSKRLNRLERDNEKLRRANEEHRRSEKRYRNLIGGSIQGVFVHRNFQILFVNDALVKVFGYKSKREMLELPSVDVLLAAGERKRIHSFARQRIHGNSAPVQYEFQGIKKNGSQIWLNNIARVIDWDGQPAFQGTVVDITKRKSAEEALRDSEERFRGLAEGSIEGILVHRNFIPLYANQAFMDIFGYATADQVLGLDLKKVPFVAPRDRRRLLSYARARMRNIDVPSRYEFQGIRQDGPTIWVEIVATRINWGGQPAILSTYNDITQRRLAQNGLQESEERYRNLVEGSIQGILVHRDHRPLFINQAYADIFGYASPDEIMRMGNILNLVAEHERKRVLGYRRARMKGLPAPTQYEYEGIRKDHSKIHLVNINKMIDWEGKRAIQTTLIDATELKRHGDRLKSSEERYRALVEGSIQGIIVHRAFKPLFVNDAFARIHGYESAQQILDFENVLDLALPDELPKLRKFFRERKKRGDESVRYEFRACHKNGSVIWRENIANSIMWNGKPAVQVTTQDITKRKLAEEKLRASGERFRNLVEGSLQGIVIQKDFVPRFANQTYANIFGYDSPEAIIQMVDLTALQAPHEKARIARLYKRHMKGGLDETRYEVQGVRKDGSLVWVELNHRPIVWEGEKVVQSTLVDITERKRAEEELRSSEEKFRNLASGSIQGVFVHRDFKLLFSNRAFARILGFDDPADLQGFDLMGAIPPEDRQRYRRQYKVRISGRGAPSHFEHSWIRKDGTSVWTHLALTVVQWDGEPAVQVAVVDITERKIAEAELRTSEERYRNLVEGSIQGMVVHRDFKPLFVNSAYAEILGFSSVKEVMEVGNILDMVHPDERARIVSIKNLRVRGENAPTHYQCKGLRRDGKTIWLEIITRLIAWDGGPAIQSTFAEITERKKLEEQLRHSQKMEALGELAGGIAHDFNNILQIIGGFSELVIEATPESDDRYAKLMQVSKAVHRGSALTRQLLMLSRRQVLALRNLEINELVRNVATMIRRLIGEHIDLTIATHDGPTTIHADPSAIEQALINLCLNARDAMPDGGRLTIETRTASLDAEYCRAHPWAAPGDYVNVCISDTGTGIAPEDREHVFEPFYTTKEAGQGTGLGLAIVYGIVRQHAGLINLYSEVGLGTTFRLYFPVSATRASPAADRPRASIQKGTGTILVAEDDEGIRTLTSQILKSGGYRVIMAEDGQRAVELFESHRDEIDLAELDLVMPRKSGRQVYEEIRAMGSDIPVFFTSGYSPKAVDLRFILEHEIKLVSKPFGREELLQVIADLLASPSKVRR